MNGDQTPTPRTFVNPADKIKLLAKEYFLKFYSSKKIFWPVSIALGLIILTLLAGLIFGSKNGIGQTKSMPTSTPLLTSTPTASVSADFLTTTQNSLNTLSRQINDFDIKQSRLAPPTLNFNISF